MRMQCAVLATLVGLSSAAATHAAGWSDSPLGRARFGDVWNDKPFDRADLAGRVVLIKTWSDG